MPHIKMAKAAAKPVRLGALIKHGYDNIRSLTVNGRHSALRAAAAEYGWFAVRRALNGLYIYTRNRDPEMAVIIKEDALYSAALRDR